ncbi:MAG: PDZ domain-containing protein [Thermoguttaceae bacterium]
MRRRFVFLSKGSLLVACMLAGLLSGVGTSGLAAEHPRGTQPQSRREIEPAIQKVYPALVRIYVVAEEPRDGRMARQRGAGSGAIISPEGYIVTNHHVAGNATRITCTLADGEEVEATKIGTDPMADIAVLKLKLSTRKHSDAPLAVAGWGNSDELKVGDVVLAMGSPMAVSQSVTRGIVSNTQMIMPRSMSGGFRLDGEDVGQIVRWIGHDAVIFHGNSGGPLVNLQGEIIGINEIGLGSLGGAIPANLAKEVVQELIRHGRVSRSWVGVEIQPRLKSDKSKNGALVASVVVGSAADKAGIRAGDLLTSFRGHPVNVELLEQLPLLNQLMFATPVGETVEVTYARDGKSHTTQLKTESLQRAVGEPLELKDWGMAVRDITRMMALERYRANTQGVVIDSIRGGGGAATAKLPLESDDIIVRVDGQPVANAAALRQLTEKILDGKTERVPVSVLFDRDGKQFLTVVKVGQEENKNRPASAAKPWASMSTQVLTSDLAESLDMAGKRGVRVTEVFKRHAAEKAGVQVGDIILTVNGRVVNASQPGDREVFDAVIRRLPLGGTAVLGIVRDGKRIELKMALEAPPVSDDNVKRWTDKDFEFTARELSYTDRLDMHIPDGVEGVLLQKVENGGWASLGGLHGEDFLMSINGKPISNVADLKAALEDIRTEKPQRVVFFVRRGIHSRFCEVEPDYQ